MKIRVQPRLQVENWSLYWKESLQTQTQCLDPIEVELPGIAAAGAASGDGGDTTVGDLLSAVSTALGWPPATSLHRLDGFTGPWERALARGRELVPELPLRDVAAAGAVGGAPAAAAVAAGDVPTVTVVRVALKADGWKIRQPGDFLTDSDSDSDAE